MAAKTAVQTEAEKNEAIDEQLNDLEKQIDRLKSMYEQYFLGIQKTAPGYIHNEVERKIRDLTQLNIRQTRLRYRFVTLQQKFGSYSAYWKRTLREIESGKYIRNLSKIGRNAIKTGAEIPEEILNAMPKRMREQVVKDRAAAIAQAKRRGKLEDGAPGDGEFALEDATSEDAMLEIGEDFAAVIKEPTELRRSLKPAPNRPHKLEEDDEFDLDAFFAQVQSEPDPPRPAPRAKAPTAPPPAPVAPAPPGVARIQSKAKEATIVGAPRPSQVMKAVEPPAKPITQPRVAAQPDPRASNPALRPSTPVIQETQALPVRASQAVISGPAQVTRPSVPAIPRNTPPAGIPAIPRSTHTQPGVAPPRPPTASPTAPTQAMPQVPLPGPPTLTQPLAKVAERASQQIKPLTIQPGSSAAHPTRPVENAPSSGTFKPAPVAGLRPPPGMSDADVNALHANYVKAKQMVGEDPGNNSREKLLRTINAQAPKIMEQYKVGSVDFSVAVKDNQVIIRAKPKSDKK